MGTNYEKTMTGASAQPAKGSPIPLMGWIKKKLKKEIKKVVKQKAKQTAKNYPTKTTTGKPINRKATMITDKSGKRIINPSHPNYIKMQSDWLKGLEKYRNR